MKQRIEISQLQQLTPSQQEKLREWWKPQRGDYFYDDVNEESFYGESVPGYDPDEYTPCSKSLPLLSMGQCIELLREYDIDTLALEFWQLAHGIEDNHFDAVDELLDRLWEAVKSIL